MQKSIWISLIVGALTLSLGTPAHSAPELTAEYNGKFVFLHVDGTFSKYTILRSSLGDDDFQPLEYNETGCTEECTYQDFRFEAGGYEYLIKADLPDGTQIQFGPTPIRLSADVVLSLSSQVTPNPVHYRTRIRWSVPAAIAQTESVRTTLTIHDPSGREVNRIYDNDLPVGDYDVVWDAKDRQGRELPSGSYFYRIQSGGHAEVGRLVLLK